MVRNGLSSEPSAVSDPAVATWITGVMAVGSHPSQTQPRVPRAGGMFNADLSRPPLETHHPRFDTITDPPGTLERPAHRRPRAQGSAYFPAGRYPVWSDIPNDPTLRWRVRPAAARGADGGDRSVPNMLGAALARRVLLAVRRDADRAFHTMITSQYPRVDAARPAARFAHGVSAGHRNHRARRTTTPRRSSGSRAARETGRRPAFEPSAADGSARSSSTAASARAATAKRSPHDRFRASAFRIGCGERRASRGNIRGNIQIVQR